MTLGEDADPRAARPGPVESSDISIRAVRGVAVVAGRGMLMRALGLVSLVVLTRFLSTREFGVLALGTTAIGLSGLLQDGGIGAALVRRKQPPTRAELRGVLGVQCGLMSALVAIAAVIAVVTRETTAAVCAIMLLSLPIASFKTPPALLMERKMSYGPATVSGFAELAAYNAIAIPLVAAGAGVWGVAGATAVAPLVGVGVLLRMVPQGRLLPTVRLGPMKPLLRFGAQFQAVGVVTTVRDQGMNVIIVAIAGLETLGLWSVVGRLMLIVSMLLASLYQVSFPAMARMLETGRDVGPVIGRTLSLVATGLGLALVALVALGADGIALLFGDEWRGAADVLPWVCLAFAILGPVSTAIIGYLYATGAARQVLVITLLHTALWLGLTAAMLDPIGIEAIGISQCLSATIEVVLLRAVTRSTVDTPFAPSTLVLVLSGALASAAGALASQWIDSGLVSVAIAVLTALSSYLLCVVCVDRWLYPLNLNLSGLRRQLVTRLDSAAA